MAKNYGAKPVGLNDPVAVDSDVWNVASAYMQLKVLKLLFLLDNYERVSQFGVEELGEDIYYTQTDIAKRRKEALFRFASTLRQLLGNVRFAIKKGDIEKINASLKRIGTVESYFPEILTQKENMITKETEIFINEEHFNICFGILQKIKEEINFPLNNAGLIFKASEEVDLDAIMNDIVNSG